MTIVEGRIYYITNKATGTYLDLSGSDNSSIIGYQNNGGHDNQRWLVKKAGDGFYLQNLRNFQYIVTKGYTNHSNVAIGPVPTVFRVSASGDAFVLGLPQSSLVLDLSGSSSANSTPVIMYNAHGGQNQSWVFTRVPST